MPRMAKATLGVVLLVALVAVAVYSAVNVFASKGVTGAATVQTTGGTLVCPATGCTASTCHAIQGQAAPGGGGGGYGGYGHGRGGYAPGYGGGSGTGADGQSDQGGVYY